MTSPDYEGNIQKEILALTSNVERGVKQIAKSLFSKRGPTVLKKRAYIPLEPINFPDGREAVIIALKTGPEDTDDAEKDKHPENNCVLKINTSPPLDNLSIPGLFNAVITIRNGALDNLALDAVTWEQSPELAPQSASCIAATKKVRIENKLEALRSCWDYLIDPLQIAMSVTPDNGETFVINEEINTGLD